MSTLAPKMSDQISYEKPVGAAPSVFQSVVGAVADMGSDFLNARNQPVSAGDKKNQALSGYVQRSREIDDSDDTLPNKARRQEVLRREYLTAFPTYREDIWAISEKEFGHEPGEGQADRVEQDSFNEWLNSAKGVAAIQATPMDAEGKPINMNDNQRDAFLRAKFAEDTALAADIERLADSKATDQVKWRELEGRWSKSVGERAASMAISAINNPEITGNPLETLNLMNETIAGIANGIRAEARAAGISTEQIEARVNEVMAPLNELKSSWEANMESPGKLLDAVRKSADLQSTEALIKTFGPHAANPQFTEYFYKGYVESEIVNGDNQEQFFNMMNDLTGMDGFNPFSQGTESIISAPEAATTDAPVVNPERIAQWKTKAAEDPEFIPMVLATATKALEGANLGDPASVETATAALQHLVLASEAYEGPIGADTLKIVLSPKVVSNIKGMGEDGTTLLTRLVTQQVRFNRALVAGTDGCLLSNVRVRQENGLFVAERQTRNPFGEMEWTKLGDGDNSQIARTTRATNYLLTATRSFPEVHKVVTNTTNWLVRGVNPTPEQVQEEDISWDDLENVQHVSYDAPNALVPLIDRTEGGGEYDTLFGFSNRGNGRFSDVKVNEMTISEVLQFSNPSGEYGQWVKAELGRQGHKARVATPMGRYQFVGTTLRQVATEMGLPDDTVFNAKTQDAMFSYLANKVLAGKSGAAARNALRGTWEGFQSVSDSELDMAIASFKGSPAPQVGSLDRRHGGPTTGDPTGMGGRPEQRPNGFMAGIETGSMAALDARQFNPKVDVTEGGAIDTETARRGSRVSAAEARAMVVATLREAGYSDDEISEVVQKEAEG